MLNFVFNEFAVVLFLGLQLFFSDSLYLSVNLITLGCQCINLFLVLGLGVLNFLLLTLYLINFIADHFDHLFDLRQILSIFLRLTPQLTNLFEDLFYFDDVRSRFLNLFNLSDELLLLLC